MMILNHPIPDAIEGNDDNNEEDKDEGADVSTLDIPADNSDAEDIVSDTDGETTGDRLISSAATLGSPIRPPRSFRDYANSSNSFQTDTAWKRLSHSKETFPVRKNVLTAPPATTPDSIGKSLAPSPIKKTKAKVSLPPDSTAVNKLNGTDAPNGKSKVTESEDEVMNENEDEVMNENEEEVEPIEEEKGEEADPKHDQPKSKSKTQKKDSESRSWASMMKKVALNKPGRSTIKNLVYNDMSDESDEEENDLVDPEKK
ncbi:unnamed protein product [Ambrosiozyma monospora]|uniref:Unnamed protein product n=1 Tax=Ambrosiozyma monospora TaxID=43982 RepID=A0ACB5THE6_AMBMO|nr:unnamed protein product [Ambrosiozyma monospora]